MSDEILSGAGLTKAQLLAQHVEYLAIMAKRPPPKAKAGPKKSPLKYHCPGCAFNGHLEKVKNHFTESDECKASNTYCASLRDDELTQHLTKNAKAVRTQKANQLAEGKHICSFVLFLFTCC
jgi:hypothetical protein